MHVGHRCKQSGHGSSVVLNPRCRGESHHLLKQDPVPSIEKLSRYSERATGSNQGGKLFQTLPLQTTLCVEVRPCLTKVVVSKKRALSPSGPMGGSTGRV